MPKNTIRGECLSTAVKTVHAAHRGHVLTHVALLRSALQAWGGVWAVVSSVWFVSRLWLGFRPEGPISGSPGLRPGSVAPPKKGFRPEGRCGLCLFCAERVFAIQA